MPNTALSIAYVRRFLTTEGLTIVIETAVLFFLARFVFRKQMKDISDTQLLIAGILASFMTIPYVWFVFPNATSWPRQTSLYWSEPFVTIVEALWYRAFLKTDWRISLGVSVVCNLASYFMDILLRANGIWLYW